LKSFRIIVRNMNLDEKLYDDKYLLRFLRARKFDLAKTEKMFQNHIEWKLKNKVDTLNEDFEMSELE